MRSTASRNRCRTPSDPGQPAAGTPPTPSPASTSAASPAPPAPSTQPLDPLVIDVCRSFGLTDIRAALPLTRGSRRTSKWVVAVAPNREFLLKKRELRAPAADIPRIELIHKLHRRLDDVGFPVTRLMLVTDSAAANRTLVLRDNFAFELTQFIRGEPFNRSIDSCRAAGRLLARFHASAAALADDSSWSPLAPGSYHNAAEVAVHASRIPAADDAAAIASRLIAAYRTAVSAVENSGYASWPRVVAHGDWHPGNLIYRADSIVAALDFDSARLEPRAADVANAALQFAFTTPGDDPAAWPPDLDEPRWSAFLTGFDSFHPDLILSRAETRALPHLMIEALVAETILPIAATGRFGKLPGPIFLKAIESKVNWLIENSHRLIRLLDS